MVKTNYKEIIQMDKLRITAIRSDWAMQRWYIAKGVRRKSIRGEEAGALGNNDLSLNNIGNVFDWVSVNQASGETVYVVNTREDLVRLIPQTDLFVVVCCVNDSVLEAIRDSRRPCLAGWNPWGWDYDSRYVRDVLLNYPEMFVPNLFGKEDLQVALEAARGMKRLRETKTLCVDKWPSGTVRSGIDVQRISDILGFEIIFIPSSEYVKANDKQTDADIKSALAGFKDKYGICVDSPHAVIMARNYLAIKELTGKHQVNCFTIDCLSNPDIDYSPCAALSIVEDEGLVYACEADLPSLVPHLLMSGMSGGKGGFLGNLNMVHVKHSEIENNTIGIEHDVLPPTWCGSGCKVLDHHGSGKGSTLWGDVKVKDVTVSGVASNGNAVHAFTGEVVDVKDLVHCRTGLWIKTDQPIRQALSNVVGHHQIVMPGKWLKQLETATKWMNKTPLM